MAVPKNQTNIGALAERARNEPEAISKDEIRVLGEYAYRCYQQATKGKCKQEAIAGAEAFRRRIEMVHIFRGLPQHLREHPTGLGTIKAIQTRLQELGLRCSERTLLRDFKKIGGAAQLRKTKPFEPGEDRSPLISRER
jgi:hypothetical protein